MRHAAGLLPRDVRLTLRAFDTAHKAASLTRKDLRDWLPSVGSADADLLPELPWLNVRSRDLARNHGVASGAVDTLVDNVVGTGFVLNARPDYVALGRTKEWADAWAERTEAAWRSFAETTDFDAGRRLNFYGTTRLVFRTQVTQGDATVVPLWVPDRGAKWATCFQVVDPDRLSNPSDRWDDATMRGGVEIDAVTTEALRYHVRKAHPFDVGIASAQGAYVWEPIPARDVTGRARFLHVYSLERPGQTRGKPAMTAVMPMFHMLDHYEQAELQAAVVNALIAVLVESQMPMDQILSLFGNTKQSPVEDYFAARREHVDRSKLKGGAVLPIFPGDKVQGFTPQRPNAQFGAFTETILRNIGTSLGLPLELLMKDFSKTNYSSARAALLEAWRHFNNRRDWLVTHWADEVYALWLEEAANKGEVEAPTFYRDRSAWCRAEWIGDGRGWVDPLKEAQASEQRRKSRVSTLQRECAEQGLDWRQVLEQQAAEKKYAEGLGIELEPLPVAPFTRGAQPDPGIDERAGGQSSGGAAAG